MCGISGFYNNKAMYCSDRHRWQQVLDDMISSIKHRGPDADGTFMYDKCCFAHTRLSVIDVNGGNQPMSDCSGSYTIVYNGEIYNTKELRDDLIAKKHVFNTTSDTEVLLHSFMEYGADFVTEVNGIFALAIYDKPHESLYLFRDQMGVKPLYYTITDHSVDRNTFVFGSEIKSLFNFPNVNPRINKESFCEIFGLGPAKTSGKGVFAGVHEVLPGQYICVNRHGIHKTTYWRLKAKPHYDSYEDTVEKITYLVSDAIKRQMVSDVPICTFLSGGLDSSLVTSICSSELKKQGRQLDTYSFDFTDNNIYFTANSFQPSEDRPYVDKMVAYTGSNHRYLECTPQKQAQLLYDSVISRDLPTMADVDSSLLYFCSEVSKENKVVLTGECADEIFGGYPWFHKKEIMELGEGNDTFCWSPDLTPRKELLNKDFLHWLNLDEYIKSTYNFSTKEAPLLPTDNETETSRRKISYLNLRWFMQTLLDRMDRTSMHNGLEARVPFADIRIVEYAYNIPWSMKAKNGVAKNLLREAAKEYLPQEIMHRKKSPYPKTYNPEYENLLAATLTDIIEDLSSPIRHIIDTDKVRQFISNPKDYGKPWYGQLMAGPQMMAYLIQVNHWLKIYG
ncbi:MAG: asparagine synthase (glutamine-hydrolyzing) [Lachnospiraceae bacterium]|nr:asparagine synthase (glutamine-hydrolyzing) [Lachnospiraceae bacterium]